MDIIQLISVELEHWERQKQEAVTQFNKATVAIETLWQLTERMKQAINEHQTDTLKREEEETAAGD